MFKPGTTLTFRGSVQPYSINVQSDKNQVFPDVEGIHFRPIDTIPLAQSLEFHRPDRCTCALPAKRGIAERRPAVVTPYSDSLVQITLPLRQCIEVGPSTAQDDWVVILAGRAFGLSDAPFLSFGPTQLSFLAPKSLLAGQSAITLKRMFLNDQYETSYTLMPAAVSVTGIAVIRSVKAGTTFVLTGSSLMDATFEGLPAPRMPACCATYALVTLTADELASMKQLILKPKDHSTPIFITLPGASKAADDTGSAAADYIVTLLQAPAAAEEAKSAGPPDAKPPAAPPGGSSPRKFRRLYDHREPGLFTQRRHHRISPRHRAHRAR